MPSRQYEVDAENILPENFWPGVALEAPADDPGALADLMLKAAAVLEMVGGTFSIVAIRREIAEGLYVPWKYRAKWESFAPAQRRAPEAPQAMTEEEFDAVADPDPTENSTEPYADEEFGPDAEAALAGTS